MIRLEVAASVVALCEKWYFCELLMTDCRKRVRDGAGGR